MLTGKIRITDGLPVLFINGKPQVPMMFFGNTEIGKNDICRKQIRLASQHHIHIHSVCCHLPVWQKRGARDFTTALDALNVAVEADPESSILLRVNLSVYGPEALEWEKEHPGDSMIFNVDYEPILDGTNPNNGATAVTLASQDWMEAAKDTLSEFHDLVQKDPKLGEHLLGYHIAAGETGEWFHCSLRERGIDLCETNKREYQKFLEARYPDIKELCKAWDLPADAFGGFQEIAIPVEIEGNDRSKPAARTLFTRPGDQRYIDYTDYSSELVADRICELASFTRKITRGEKLIVFFYGYYFDLYDARTGHFRVEKVLACPDIDAFSSPVCYTDRNEGGVGALMSAADSFIRAGKLWLVENDIRSCLCMREEGLFDWVPPVPSIELLIEVYKREFGQMAVHGLGCWYMDLFSRGWQYHPDIWEAISPLYKCYFELSRHTGRLVPDVAILTDEKAMSVAAHAEGLGMNLLYRQRLEFYRAGIKFGFYLAGDYLNGDLAAPLVIYLDPFDLSREQAVKMNEKFERDQSSVLYLHGFGKTSPETAELLCGFPVLCGPDEMTDLTMTPENGFLSANPRASLNSNPEGIHPVTANGQDEQGENAIPKSNPAYYCYENPFVTVLARYQSGPLTGKIGIGYRQKGKRKIFFAAPMALSSLAIREIAKLSGVPVYCENEDTLLAGNRIITLHTKTTGEKTLCLPGNGDSSYLEIYSGCRYDHASQITFQAKANHTYTFVADPEELGEMIMK